MRRLTRNLGESDFDILHALIQRGMQISDISFCTGWSEHTINKVRKINNFTAYKNIKKATNAKIHRANAPLDRHAAYEAFLKYKS